MMFGNWKIKTTQCTQCTFATLFTYNGVFKEKAKQIKNLKSFAMLPQLCFIGHFNPPPPP